MSNKVKLLTLNPKCPYCGSNYLYKRLGEDIGICFNKECSKECKMTKYKMYHIEKIDEKTEYSLLEVSNKLGFNQLEFYRFLLKNEMVKEGENVEIYKKYLDKGYFRIKKMINKIDDNVYFEIVVSEKGLGYLTEFLKIDNCLKKELKRKNKVL